MSHRCYSEGKITLLRKIPKFHLISWCGNVYHPKLCGNCSFPQNFHTKKSDEISVRMQQILSYQYHQTESHHTVNSRLSRFLIKLLNKHRTYLRKMGHLFKASKNEVSNYYIGIYSISLSNIGILFFTVNNIVQCKMTNVLLLFLDQLLAIYIGQTFSFRYVSGLCWLCQVNFSFKEAYEYCHVLG